MTFSRREAVITSLAGMGLYGGFGAVMNSRSSFAGEVEDNPNVIRALNAAYEMRILSTGQIYGHEHWTLFVHTDGTRTLSVRMINNDFRAPLKIPGILCPSVVESV